MSKSQKTTVTCQKCNAQFETTIWDSVNTNLSPNLPQAIISGGFFDATCPTCGYVWHLEYDVLYHDMKHHAMVWVVHRADDYDSQVETIRSSIIIPGDITRIVHSFPELREKIAILEAGRDDRIVEIMKCILFVQASKIVPDICLENTQYICEENKEYINFYDKNGLPKTLAFEATAYSNIQKQFEPILNAESNTPYEVVNHSWALKTIERYYNPKSAETKSRASSDEQPISHSGPKKQKNTTNRSILKMFHKYFNLH